MSDNVQIILLAFIKLYHVQFLSDEIRSEFFFMGFKDMVAKYVYSYTKRLFNRHMHEFIPKLIIDPRVLWLCLHVHISILLRWQKKL